MQDLPNPHRFLPIPHNKQDLPNPHRFLPIPHNKRDPPNLLLALHHKTCLLQTHPEEHLQQRLHEESLPRQNHPEEPPQHRPHEEFLLQIALHARLHQNCQ